jgi:hypothetical protein
VDVAKASDQIDQLIDKRSRRHEEANASEMAWKASVRRHHARLRRQRRGEWFCYWSALAESLRKSADEFERRALELLEDEPSKGSKHAEET